MDFWKKKEASKASEKLIGIFNKKLGDEYEGKEKNNEKIRIYLYGKKNLESFYNNSKNTTIDKKNIKT